MECLNAVEPLSRARELPSTSAPSARGGPPRQAQPNPLPLFQIPSNLTRASKVSPSTKNYVEPGLNQCQPAPLLPPATQRSIANALHPTSTADLSSFLPKAARQPRQKTLAFFHKPVKPDPAPAQPRQSPPPVKPEPDVESDESELEVTDMPEVTNPTKEEDDVVLKSDESEDDVQG